MKKGQTIGGYRLLTDPQTANGGKSEYAFAEKDGEQFFLEQALEFLHVFDLLAVSLVAQFPKNFLRSRATQIGANERGLEIVECVAVDLLADRNDFLDALREILTRARHRLLHAVKEASFLFFLETAEQSLNHRKPKVRL